jgi:hypothetical protein
MGSKGLIGECLKGLIKRPQGGRQKMISMSRNRLRVFVEVHPEKPFDSLTDFMSSDPALSWSRN